MYISASDGDKLKYEAGFECHVPLFQSQHLYSTRFSGANYHEICTAWAPACRPSSTPVAQIHPPTPPFPSGEPQKKSSLLINTRFPSRRFAAVMTGRMADIVASILQVVAEIYEIAEGIKESDRQARELFDSVAAIGLSVLAVTQGRISVSSESLRQLLETFEKIRHVLGGYARTANIGRAWARKLGISPKGPNFQFTPPIFMRTFYGSYIVCKT